MAYEKTDWKGRKGSNLNRFSKEQETTRSVILNNEPNSVTQPGTPFSVKNMNKIEQGIYDAHEAIATEAAARQAADNQSNQAIENINKKIPNQASETNQLADKNFTNSSISNMAANYVTPNAAGDAQFANLGALRSGPWYHGGASYAPSQNDYAIYLNADNSVWRAAFNGQLWSPTYKINDTPFTAAQLAALNSQITAALVQKLLNPDSEPAQNSDNLVKSGGVFAWFGGLLSALKTTAKTVIGAINELFDNKANTASPTFTGTPRAPTPASSVNDTQIATMAAVRAVANETIIKSSTELYHTSSRLPSAGSDYNIPIAFTDRPPRMGDLVMSTLNSVLARIEQVNSTIGNTARVTTTTITDILYGQIPSSPIAVQDVVPNLNFLTKDGFYYLIAIGGDQGLPDEAEGAYHWLIVGGGSLNEAYSSQILITQTGQMFVRGQSHIQGSPFIKEDWRRLDGSDLYKGSDLFKEGLTGDTFDGKPVKRFLISGYDGTPNVMHSIGFDAPNFDGNIVVSCKIYTQSQERMLINPVYAYLYKDPNNANYISLMFMGKFISGLFIIVLDYI